MKIGIITFHRPLNFGAVLQAVALVRKTNELGGQAEIIDYINSFQESSIKNNSFKSAKGWKNKIKSVIFSRINRIRMGKFTDFLNSNAHLSEKQYKDANIKDSSDSYDLFVTGSDQVWNLNLTGEDYNYFLKFVKDDNKKVSYASSFGYSEIPNKYVFKTKEYLEKYKKLSVREKQAANMIKDIVGRQAEVVVDPTLLLRKDDWKKLAKKPEFYVPDRYILLYAVSPTKEDFLIAKKLSKKIKMKVVLINYNKRYVFGMKNCFEIGPAEFLWLFDNATYIVTNSFHGTAFSINFNKPFFVRLSKKSNNVNSRIETIIDLCDLKDRYVDIDSDINNHCIDWGNVNEKLNIARTKSEQIIKEYVGDNNGKFK